MKKKKEKKQSFIVRIIDNSGPDEKIIYDVYHWEKTIDEVLATELSNFMNFETLMRETK